MSKRMTSETIIFDTQWLTETDFDEWGITIAIIDYQAYDALKIIVDVQNIVLEIGDRFQEFDVYKIENQVIEHRHILVDDEILENINLGITNHEGDVILDFLISKTYWEENIKGLGSIYIKGVKR